MGQWVSLTNHLGPVSLRPRLAFGGARHILEDMRPLTGLVLLAALTASGAAQAQVPPYGADPHRYQVDRHRAEMERLRAQADARAATARRMDTETRITLQELEAARRPPTPYVEYARPPADPDAASARHQRTREAVTQIDDWLERSPD